MLINHLSHENKKDHADLTHTCMINDESTDYATVKTYGVPGAGYRRVKTALEANKNWGGLVTEAHVTCLSCVSTAA